MKKVIFCLLILGIGSVVSCNSKKYSKCCYFSATENIINGSASYSQPYNSNSCATHESKKDLNKWLNDNAQLSLYNQALSDPIHWSNPTYSCK